jgi:hypothetical protein
LIRCGGPTSANFSPVRSTITQLSGSVHFPNTRGVVSGCLSFSSGFDIVQLHLSPTFGLHIVIGRRAEVKARELAKLALKRDAFDRWAERLREIIS